MSLENSLCRALISRPFVIWQWYTFYCKSLNNELMVKLFHGPSTLSTIHRHLILSGIGTVFSKTDCKKFDSISLFFSLSTHLTKEVWLLNAGVPQKGSLPFICFLGNSQHGRDGIFIFPYFENLGFSPDHSWAWSFFLSFNDSPGPPWLVHMPKWGLGNSNLILLQLPKF